MSQTLGLGPARVDGKSWRLYDVAAARGHELCIILGDALNRSLTFLLYLVSRKPSLCLYSVSLGTVGSLDRWIAGAKGFHVGLRVLRNGRRMSRFGVAQTAPCPCCRFAGGTVCFSKLGIVRGITSPWTICECSGSARGIGLVMLPPRGRFRLQVSHASIAISLAAWQGSNLQCRGMRCSRGRVTHDGAGI